MKSLNKIVPFLFFIVLSIGACEKIKTLPDEPVISFKDFGLFFATDALGNEIILGKLEFTFTDGDGNVGLDQPQGDLLPDSLKYNLFMQLYEFEGGQPKKVEGLKGDIKYRIPYIERTGQNKTLEGTIYVDIEYKIIEYDSIFYTFYIMDRDFNRSNTDTTAVISFAGISL